MCCLEIVNICFLRFKWKIANIFARLWKSAQFCHWAIFPSSAANFRPADRWNRKSQIIPKLGRILKFKPQQCYKLIKPLLQTENEGRLGFELWPRFADFARFFCAFALKHRKALTALAEKSTPLNKKKPILVQHGGNFVSVLLPPVLRVLSSLLT